MIVATILRRSAFLLALLTYAWGDGYDGETPALRTTEEAPRLATRPVTSLGAITLGTPADTVLALRGRAISVERRGSDMHGLVVAWHHPEGTYVMGLRELDGITAYRVIDIQVADEPTASNLRGSATPEPSRDNPNVGMGDELTLASLMESPLGTRYRLSSGGGWDLKDGLYNNQINTPTLPETMFEVSTRGAAITHAGVTFLGSSRLETDRRTFVTELLAWMNPEVSEDPDLMRVIDQRLEQHVGQVYQAAAINVAGMTIHAANVGGDAVIAIKLK